MSEIFSDGEVLGALVTVSLIIIPLFFLKPEEER